MVDYISAFWSMLELCFFYFFWHIFFQPKVSKFKTILFFIATWIFIMAYMNIGLAQTQKTLLSFVTFVALSFSINKGKWYQHIVVALLATGVVGIVDTAFLYGFSAIMNISLSELVWKKLLYVTIVSIGKLFSIFLAWLFSRLRKNESIRPIQGKWLLLSLLFPAASNAMLLMMFQNFQDEADISESVVFFCIILAVANIAILYLIDLIEKSTEDLKETALLNQQMYIQTEHILALEKSYRAQRQFTHDFRNQLQAISDLLAMGELSAVQDYVHQLQGQQTTRIFTVNSHHPIIDAVLNHKCQTAKENNIDCQIQVNDLSQVKIDTDMIIVLLSNLLDNAIEGCCRVTGQRSLFCSLVAEDSLLISVRNSSVPVKIVNNMIPTSKSSKADHGYGLSRIKYILNQLNAEYAFEYKTGWFAFVAEIPLE